MINEAVWLVLNKWVKVICERVEQEWNSRTGLADMQKEISSVVSPMVGNTLIGTISASGFGAFIGEYGSGHLLDESSPYFNEYRNSDMYNQERVTDGNEFVGRAKGETIYRPDGTKDISTGKAKGMRLEHALGNLPAYQAFPAQHIIKQEINFALPQIIADIETSVGKAIVSEIKEQTIKFSL